MKKIPPIGDLEKNLSGNALANGIVSIVIALISVGNYSKVANSWTHWGIAAALAAAILAVAFGATSFAGNKSHLKGRIGIYLGLTTIVFITQQALEGFE